MDNGKILVTGGAGYIGSHVVRQLGNAGENVITLDNFSTGFEAAVTCRRTRDRGYGRCRPARPGLRRTRHRHGDAFCGAHYRAGVSLRSRSSTTATTRRAAAPCSSGQMRTALNTLCFPQRRPCTAYLPTARHRKRTPTRPINPYGSSKLMTEWMLRDLAFAGGPSYVALRYFNVAGCEPSGTIGQSTPKATLLVKVACEAAVGSRPGVKHFRHRLPDAGWHGPARLHSCRRSRYRAPRRLDLPSKTAANRRRSIAATATATACARYWLRSRRSTVSRIEHQRRTAPCRRPSRTRRRGKENPDGAGLDTEV